MNKRLLRIPTQRSTGYIFSLYMVIIVLVLLWAGEILGAIIRNDSGRTPAMYILFILFPLALLVSVALIVARTVAQQRAGVPGSRLRIRLVGSFALIVFMTAVPLGILSTIFLRTTVSLWLAPGTGQALEAGRRVSTVYYNDGLRRLRDLAESNFFRGVVTDEELETAEQWAMLTDVAPYLNALEISGSDGQVRMGDPKLFLESGIRVWDTAQGALIPRVVDEDTIVAWRENLDGKALVLSSSLPQEFESNIRLIDLAIDEWNRYDRLRGNINGSLALFGVFISGPLILMALFLGTALADRIIRPLVALGDATGKISEGDFSFRVLSRKEDELGFLTQSFNKMIRELEVSRTKIVQTEKVAAWQVIAQRLAHELRNPLTPIKLSAQRVQRKSWENGLDGETVAKAMDFILQEVDGLDKLLQDFRDFAGGGPPKTESLTLRPILEETMDRFRTMNASVLWETIPGKTDPPVMVDRLQMRQVLVNLLKNAMEANSSRITVRLDLVRRGTTPYVRVQIRDNGEGIAPERVAAVFQPYHSTRDRGSGLGLAVVQRIIHDHHGRIWFESEPDVGTVFYIDIPTEELT